MNKKFKDACIIIGITGWSAAILRGYGEQIPAVISIVFGLIFVVIVLVERPRTK